MEDNRTSGAKFIDDMQGEQLAELRNEFHAVASTHLTKEYFFWAFGIFISLTVAFISILYNHIEEHEKNDASQFNRIAEAHQKFDTQNTQFQVTYAKIEVSLIALQKDMLELKNTLTSHDKK